MNDPLKNIPSNLLSSMSKECNVDTSESKSLLEAVRKLVTSRQEDKLPQQQQVPMTSVNGYILPIDAMTMIMTVLVELSKTNKDVDKVLKAFDFRFPDVNGKPLYPRKNNERKVRSSKRRV